LHGATHRLLCAGLFIGILTGCQKKPRPLGADANVSPRSGGTIVFATDREPLSLDPARSSDQPQSDIARAYLDSLVRQETDGSFTPWLAESWDISKDEKTYTFHLRKDVTFTDGTPFNAAAAKANVDHWLDPATVSSESGVALKHLQSMATPDAFTFVIKLAEPYADLLSVLASPFAGLQSPAGIARGSHENDQRPIGTGPFLIKSWQKQSQVVLVRNDKYHWAPRNAHHQGPAYAEKLIWKFIPEGTTRFAALRSGEIAALETIPPVSFQEASRHQELTVMDGVRAGVPVQLDFNTRRAPFEDVSVRKAFRCSVDVAASLKSIFFGAYHSFGGALAPNTIYFDAAFEGAYPYDLARANALLDGAGWRQQDSSGYRIKNGRRLTVHAVLGSGATTQEYFLLDQIAGSAKKSGFEVRYEKLDDSQAQARRTEWDYDLAKDYWGGPNTPARRQTLYSDAQRIISSEALSLPLYLQPLQYAYRNDLIRRVDRDPRTNQISFYDAWVINP
jgi:peptide/nickel transport system substrate-binding protein